MTAAARAGESETVRTVLGVPVTGAALFGVGYVEYVVGERWSPYITPTGVASGEQWRGSTPRAR